jgi:hypothetical protein
MPNHRRNPFGQALSTFPAQPPDIYDSLRVAERRTRSRQWEKNHLKEKVTYRGIDPNLALRVKQIAGDIQVRDGEVARTLLEYALRAYSEGDLDLIPRPNPERLRMTLFPLAETGEERRKRGGMPARKKEAQEPAWRVVTTWRSFPSKLRQEITALASEKGLDVPTGELISVLLRFSLKAFEYGLLKLEPVEEVQGYTLQDGGSI